MTNYNDGKPSPEEIAKHFSYDPETGVVVSLTRRKNAYPGKAVGGKDRQGYLVTTLYKTPLKLHRIAWVLTHGEWPEAHIDHINGVTSDNRIANLRAATNSENKQNVGKLATNTSGKLGVSFHKKSQKWAANIKVKGKQFYLGIYDTIDEASRAYLDAKNRVHPFYRGLE